MPIYFCLLLSMLFMEVSLQEVTFNLAIQDKQGVPQAEVDNSGPGSRRSQGAEILVPTECKNWKACRELPCLYFTEEINGGPERVSNYFRLQNKRDKTGPGTQVFYPVCNLWSILVVIHNVSVVHIRWTFTKQVLYILLFLLLTVTTP